MLTIGLTGGIASGKSTVSRRLTELGATVIDADAIARALQEPGQPGLEGIVEEFGPSVLTPDGRLDRAALGALVFGDPEARQRLNAIVHPLVRAEAERLAAAAGEDAVLVEDIPLLVETGQHERFDHVLTVQAPVEERVRRMVEDRAMTETDARARIAAQATDEERAAVSDTVLANDDSVQRLLDRVDAWWEWHVEPRLPSPARPRRL
ncbi:MULTISPECIES: dephospho-CoA kinase [unclassified Kocuria]|uniref:dephospho-CoA kinase n=1 Tax=unclassified Kocuria TaxID=2649579 RepID=UPI00064A8908|nr:MULTISPECIES: dephospho-CoA kinase [unclassified Kocuria]KLU09260.1 dephospho-CoA kinase [Kocuria sp. SM24M-10]OLT09241.1 dephospho-CoA kinase [Kocuria sp. CNJ-770]